MPKKKSQLSYDSVALGVLIGEFPFSDKKKIEEKIKGRLRYRKLGPLDPKRIEALRKLKDALQKEIGKQDKSKYYIGPRGRARFTTYVAMTDFDLTKLTADMIRKHPKVSKFEVKNFVPFAIACYHLL